MVVCSSGWLGLWHDGIGRGGFSVSGQEEILNVISGRLSPVFVMLWFRGMVQCVCVTTGNRQLLPQNPPHTPLITKIRGRVFWPQAPTPAASACEPHHWIPVTKTRDNVVTGPPPIQRQEAEFWILKFNILLIYISGVENRLWIPLFYFNLISNKDISGVTVRDWLWIWSTYCRPGWVVATVFPLVRLHTTCQCVWLRSAVNPHLAYLFR